MSEADLTCPLCKETGFDRIGLYGHFERGWCPEFPKIEEERRLEDERLAEQSARWRAEAAARKLKAAGGETNGE